MVQVSLLLTLSACRWLVKTEDDPLTEAMEQVDALYAQRADRAALEESKDQALSALAEFGELAPIQWRLSRAYVALAWGYGGDQAETFYLDARTFGLQCLGTATGYAGRVESAHGLITLGAARQLPQASLPCLEWTLIAWVRWVELRGPSASLDLDAITLLSDRALTLDPEHKRWGPLWARGMVEVLRPGPAPRDTTLARDLFVQAIGAEPQLAIAHLDFARYSMVLDGDGESWRRELRRFPGDHPEDQDGEWVLENRVARALAEEALSAGEQRWESRW